MITQETAEKIWTSHKEISWSEKRLSEIKISREKGLFDVSPLLAEEVIIAHIRHKKADLAEANEQARIELEKQDDCYQGFDKDQTIRQ